MDIVNTFQVNKGRLKVGHDVRMPGDLVPEAEHWRHLDAYLTSGELIRVQIRADDPRLAGTAGEAETSVAPSTDTVSSDQYDQIDFSSMTIAEIRDWADEHDIDLPSRATKDELIELVEAG